MGEINVRHIHVLEFPKLLLWTDRDLEYFLEEMTSEERRMNNDIYDVFIKEADAGKDYQPEEAFNLAYYECVRISLARYPESRDIIDVLEMDIQHNQTHVDYGYTNMIMNMVWAMLHSTNTATRFANKLHSYLVNSRKLEFGFRCFFTPNDIVPDIYNKKEEPRYNVVFTPCPIDIGCKSSNVEWCKLTIGYKENLIEELLLLWPKDKRDYIRKCIMDEKLGHMNNFADYVKSFPDCEDDNACVKETVRFRKEWSEWKTNYTELEKMLHARTKELEKWHNLYEQAQSEISKWQSQYEKMRNADKKAKYEHQEVLRLKHENAILKETIVRQKYQLNKDSMIVATAKKYIGDSPLTPEVILNRFANDEEFKKRERAFENKIKDLQDKLGKKTVPLSVLAKGLMDYAEEAGISEAHELFNHLNNMLISEPEWTNNVPELKKFFKKARREMERRQITMTGEHATYNENNN
ncbi:hypothetical protein [Prevotella communis]|uniref:hypothetical protein n=1 Tax=Prevotella communis TaxID=2913614 RepID=UPI001EDB1926|nr:hypothetical protein [Prevotella communis]UKK55729.1 hypothetical protein L6476_09675 [Prevotella communis]